MADTMTPKRWNQFKRHINNNLPKEELVPPIANEEESEIYDEMVRELEEARKDDPLVSFWPTENEW